MFRYGGDDGDVVLGVGGVQQGVETAGPGWDFLLQLRNKSQGILFVVARHWLIVVKLILNKSLVFKAYINVLTSSYKNMVIIFFVFFQTLFNYMYIPT